MGGDQLRGSLKSLKAPVKMMTFTRDMVSHRYSTEPTVQSHAPHKRFGGERLEALWASEFCLCSISSYPVERKLLRRIELLLITRKRSSSDKRLTRVSSDH